MRTKTWLVCAAVVALTGFAGVAPAREPAAQPAPTTRPSHAEAFTVAQTGEGDQVSVRSHSTLGSFTSKCNEVTGHFRFDPHHPAAIHGRFSMPVTGIHTGIKLRDHDLRSAKWLDAATYPDIVITVSRAQDVHRESAGNMSMTLVGTCSMHGVTQDVRIPVTVTYSHTTQTTDSQTGRDAVSIRAQFEVKLSDYHIKGTSPLGLKVDDVQRVSVSVFAIAEPAAS